jgi:hypothetical protein
MIAVSPEMVASHLDAFAGVLQRWQLGPEAGRHAGGLACPVARIPLQWTEFFGLPIVLDAVRRGGLEGGRALALGLVDFLRRVQRPDGSFDAGFCGDLWQPCNAAFALRPLATALGDWPTEFGDEHRNRLSRVLERAAEACVDGGMNTANHRWVAAGGLAHAARALEAPRFAEAAHQWTSGEIDIDADGAYSEKSPKYALVSNDAFLDLEELLGRRDLGDLARRSLDYLRAVMLPDGEFAAVGSARYDTDGSSDGAARAALVFERLGERELAARCLARLWCSRSAPGLLVPCDVPPLGEGPKAKLYPSTTSAIAAENLLRWLRLRGPAPRTSNQADGGELVSLPASGLLRYRWGDFALVAGRGPNLFEVHHGGAVIEGARLLAHVTGWNGLLAVDQRLGSDGMELELNTAPGSPVVRLPQFHRVAPGERRPGNPVPATRARLALRCGPGPALRIEIELDGPEGANAVLEIGARPDQAIFTGDGVRVATPWAAPARGRWVVGGAGPERIVVDHRGGSGHALQVERYGYGSGDDLWSPSFRPAVVRIGAELPAALQIAIRGD